MESTRGLDSSSVLLKEINNTRQKIGEDPYLDDSDTIREALEIRLCFELVSNDPLYESKKTRRIYQIEEEIRIQKEKDRQELLELKRLSNLKKEQERIAREKKEEEERIAIELAKKKFTDAILNRLESYPITVQLIRWGSTGSGYGSGPTVPNHTIIYQCYGASGLMGFALVVKYKNNLGEIREYRKVNMSKDKCGGRKDLNYRRSSASYPNKADLEVLYEAHKGLYKGITSLNGKWADEHQIPPWREHVESVYVEWDGEVGDDSMINPSMFGLPKGTRIDVSRTKNKFYLYQSD